MQRSRKIQSTMGRKINQDWSTNDLDDGSGRQGHLDMFHMLKKLGDRLNRYKKNTQIELLEVKTTVYKIKNILYEINGR